MDVLATAIRGELTVFALSDLELCYAPPYSSAKDPVNMPGYVATNVVEGAVTTIQYYEIDAAIARGGLLLDVREPQEFARGHIAGSINIALSEPRQRLVELPRDRVIYVNCQSGLRSYLATRILARHGLRAINLDGGYQTTSMGRAP